MNQQQRRLDELRAWLTATEDRISRLDALANADTTLAGLKNRREALASLRTDLESQQRIVDSLSTMVVVVDDSKPDNGIIIFI